MSGIQKNKAIVFVALLWLIFAPKASAQEAFRVMFYNVENLYDTINNPKTLDDEFTPDGTHHWDGYRYQKKLENIAKVISSMGGQYPPALVGLCEVENNSVLSDLTQKSALARHQYRYVISHSKDARGSNVALLYQRDQFKLISQKAYTPKIGKDKTTRDLLHITGQVVSGDTFDIFVCHFPSRSEGIAKSEPNRVAVAKLLRKKVEETTRQRKNAHIIIMGDFNDSPNDKSIKESLNAKKINPRIEASQLYNLCSTSGEETIKSYKYRGRWDYMDQLIVNGKLLDKKQTSYVIHQQIQVYKPNFLLEEDTKYGGQKPHRTYSGWSYLGGTSDHLPIYIDLYIKE